MWTDVRWKFWQNCQKSAEKRDAVAWNGVYSFGHKKKYSFLKYQSPTICQLFAYLITILYTEIYKEVKENNWTKIKTKRFFDKKGQTNYASIEQETSKVWKSTCRFWA